ncbi:nitrate/nitrite transporter NrtS [Kordiimonas laminariae]|uniref:nitrate/nitrite transporter NrtS n=1 Tax=Kordiimonas laminariae TaxID=2917717 RepID=UPI001FF47B44|nr:nitrate/nitrite transporter NrtS [Kordiimonas laminariae]MCK0069620.1 nitrate/nitrite transporter NrtS [Kordiimonas laminariae]
MFWQFVFEKKTVKRALKVALVVGTILVTINQWQALTGDVPLDIIKVILTYIVPYCVSSYSTATALQEQQNSSGE